MSNQYEQFKTNKSNTSEMNTTPKFSEQLESLLGRKISDIFAMKPSDIIRRSVDESHTSSTTADKKDNESVGSNESVEESESVDSNESVGSNESVEESESDGEIESIDMSEPVDVSESDNEIESNTEIINILKDTDMINLLKIIKTKPHLLDYANSYITHGSINTQINFIQINDFKYMEQYDLLTKYEFSSSISQYKLENIITHFKGNLNMVIRYIINEDL